MKSFTSIMSVDFRKSSSLACFAMALYAALNFCETVVPVHSTPVAPAAPARTLFGTLDTQTSSVGTENRAGLSVAMFELDWASFEPEQGVFNNSYIASMEQMLSQYRTNNMLVTLGLGLDDPPSWVYSLPDSYYVNQFGTATPGPDMVFSEAVRQAAAGYLTQVAADMPLRNIWAIRLTSGGDDEMLYPAGGTFWSFENSALTGADLPPTMTPDPFPGWRPGNPGLSTSQIDQYVTWYVRGLDDVTAWQMQLLNGLGFTGHYQLVTPGSGTRPDVLTQVEEADLPNDGITGVGAVWNRYYAMLPDKTNVVAYVSSVADESGNNDSCQPGDDRFSLTDPALDSWSATRWIARIAAANGLLVAGENPGFESPSALDGSYLDPSSSGMMADAIRQATTCHFQVFYWAHDQDLWDGTVSFSLYRQDIAAAG